MKSFYITDNLHQSIQNIVMNTNWKRINFNTFLNGGEEIKVTTLPDRLRGFLRPNVYYDFCRDYMNTKTWLEWYNMVESRQGKWIEVGEGYNES